MVESLKIHTPLLRLFATFYRCLGTQIAPPQWTNCRSLLRLLWNLTVYFLVIYGLYTLDCLKLQSIVRTCSMAKPLFYSFVYAGTKFTYPALFIFKFLYFFFYGNRLVSLLDAPAFRIVYRGNKRKSLSIFIFYVTMPHVFFVWAMVDRVSRTDSQPLVSQALEYFCLYMVFNYLYWMCILVHYCQHAFTRLLQNIKQKIEKTQNASWSTQIQLENEVLHEIQYLALLNQKLNAILNAPLMAVIVLNIFNIILIFSLALICKPYIRPIMHMIFAYLYTKYLVWTNEAIRQTLSHILEQLRNLNERKERRILRLKRNSASTEIAAKWNSLLQLIQGHRIRLYEMDMYRDYFALKVFQIIALDYHFTIHAGLFILCLVVFFTQTR